MAPSIGHGRAACRSQLYVPAPLHVSDLFRGAEIVQWQKGPCEHVAWTRRSAVRACRMFLRLEVCRGWGLEQLYGIMAGANPNGGTRGCMKRSILPGVALCRPAAREGRVSNASRPNAMGMDAAKDKRRRFAASPLYFARHETRQSGSKWVDTNIRQQDEAIRIDL